MGVISRWHLWRLERRARRKLRDPHAWGQVVVMEHELVEGADPPIPDGLSTYRPPEQPPA
jgi:hypothetical protein